MGHTLTIAQVGVPYPSIWLKVWVSLTAITPQDSIAWHVEHQTPNPAWDSD